MLFIEHYVQGIITRTYDQTVSGKRTAKDNKELTEEDHQTIATIVLGWVFFWNMLKKVTPEEYAEKVFLKIGKSKNKPSIIRLLFDLIRESSNPIRSPDEFNQKLARDMLVQSLENVAKDNTLESRSQEQFRRYLDRRRMFEVLLCLRDRGVLKHLKHKGAIRKEMHRLPGRVCSHSFDTYSERFGGKPSADVKTYKMERISNLLQKPKARTLVYGALKEIDILYEV